MSRTTAVVLAAVLLAGCAARRPFDQGLAYFRQGQYAQARAAFDEALRVAPDSPDAYTNRSFTRVRRGDWGGGSECYPRGAALARKAPDAPYNGGPAWIARREHPRAV